MVGAQSFFERMSFWLLLIVLAVQRHTVNLTWIPSVSPSLKYQELWRGVGCQPDCSACTFDKRKKLPVTATNWIDANVKNGETYCYYVTVTDKTGKMSDPSNIAQAVIP